MKIPHLRWWIAGLLFLASILNYIDRQALSILAPTIQADLNLSDQQYATIVSFFLAAYTVAYLLSGRVVDVLGARLSLALFIGWWSLANALTGLARGAMSLGAFRFLLGLGEAGGYTASPKVVSEWFPAKDRGIAVGLYSMGSAVGATVAPILVIAIASQYSWRGAFVVTGLLGLVFVVLWLTLYRSPEKHPWLTAGERELILSGRDDAKKDDLPKPGEKVLWKMILSNRAAWALMGARMLTDPLWYFYLFWLPKYLHTVRGLEQRELAGMWKIFVAADVGFLLAGFVAGWLIKKGSGARVARRRVMLACACLTPVSLLVPMVSATGSVFALAMVVALAHTAWLTSITSYIVDLVPKSILGTAFGFIAAGSALGGIFMNQAVGWAVAHFSYTPCFYAMAVLHPVAFWLVWRFARRAWNSESDPALTTAG
ncbi:MAG: exuT 4 [Rariglobus sp.]|jgi:ACS family hexuronate transporter-like MFS transporter|nr:exuT 4 [Rariglobus sp.]